MKKQSFVTKKSKLIAEEFRSFNGKAERVIIKNVPFRVNITPCGIEKFDENDESITYKRRETLWYKSHSKAEPEILAFRGLAIWSYNEFLTDVVLEEIPYRIFYNSVSKKFLANEIVSFDYDGKGAVLLKNPVDKQKSEQLQEFFVNQNLPKNNRKDTLVHFIKGVEIFYKKQELKDQPRKKPIGKQPKSNLIRATLWCIKWHPKNMIYKRQTILLAYKKFGEETQTEDSFIKSVRTKWNNLTKEYNKQSEEFRKANSKEIYARSKLKIPRNVTKQKNKKDAETFKY